MRVVEEDIIRASTERSVGAVPLRKSRWSTGLVRLVMQTIAMGKLTRWAYCTMNAKKTSRANVKRVDGMRRGGASPSTRTIVFPVPIPTVSLQVRRRSVTRDVNVDHVSRFYTIPSLFFFDYFPPFCSSHRAHSSPWRTDFSFLEDTTLPRLSPFPPRCPISIRSWRENWTECNRSAILATKRAILPPCV